MSTASAARRAAAGGEPVLFLAAFSWAAAAVHAVVAVPHFEEFPLFGAAFVAVALAQGAWAVLAFRACDRRRLGAGIALNAGVLAVWAISRTAGLPIGPEPGEPEAVGLADLATGVDELALIVLAAALLRRHASARSDALGIWARQAALTVLIFCGVGLMVAGHTR
jgi:hypothetical protein